MNIKKGTLLKIKHFRKGNFIGRANEDFEITTEDTFYPISLESGEIYRIAGFGSLIGYKQGENIPCRSSLCEIELFEKSLDCKDKEIKDGVQEFNDK